MTSIFTALRHAAGRAPGAARRAIETQRGGGGCQTAARGPAVSPFFIESELGPADKDVLKNFTLVEKFIQDIIRKSIEEELVFPNFHMLVFRQ